MGSGEGGCMVRRRFSAVCGEEQNEKVRLGLVADGTGECGEDTAIRDC